LVGISVGETFLEEIALEVIALEGIYEDNL
jgi:hypothetical protein